MPFISGALSVRRYAVTGEIPSTLEQTATLAIRRYEWRPIDDSRGEKESFGWVNPRDILQRNFTFEDVFDRPYVYLGVRRDKKAFSQVLFRARREKAFERAREEKGLKKLSRQHRIAIEEELGIKMLKETSPSSAFSELVWDINANMVLMGATGNALCERIQEVFEATFDLRLRPMFPSMIGADYIASQGLEREFELVSAMAPQRGGKGGE